MLQFFQIASYAIPFVCWLLIIISSGVSGSHMVMCLVSAALSGWILGYYVVRHGVVQNQVPTKRAWGAVAFCVLLPLISFLRSDWPKSTPPKADTSLTSSKPESRPATTPNTPILTNVQDVMTTNAESFDKGHDFGVKDAMGANLNSEPLIVKIAEGTWKIRFQIPGPRLIETNLDLPIGQVYYVSTERLVPNLQIGWMDKDGALKLCSLPASEFVNEKPASYQMASKANYPKLVFSTQLVPDGTHEIKIVKGVAKLTPDEYAPGIKLDRPYR